MFKVLENGKTPTRESKFSCCFDLYSREDVVIKSGETKTINLGVKISDDKLSYTAERSFCQFIDLEQCIRVIHDFKSQYYLQLTLNNYLAKTGLIQPYIQNISLYSNDELFIIVHNPVTSKSSGYYPNNKTIPSFDLFNIKKGDKVAQVMLLAHKSYLFGDYDV